MLRSVTRFTRLAGALPAAARCSRMLVRCTSSRPADAPLTDVVVSSVPFDRYDMKGHFIFLAEYNIWATNKLLNEHVQSLTDEEYHRDCGLFFKSIHRTLNHMLLVNRLWYGRFTGYQIYIRGLDDEVESNRKYLDYDLRESNERWLRYVRQSSVEELLAVMTYRDTHGRTRRTPRGPLLNHVIANHSTHHRGQISAALTMMSKAAPELDMVYFVRPAEVSA